ncbi:helix-turn-helix domain-containing protein [Dyadobacter fermentans]|uniref:helix-turn-helix domain-containing protein n=1 Tax=Dyadobacter fermentans TaxID=94254 RepID=UPI001CBCFE9A|nr:helix-turn-helix domain-containing protein [Dyadobacter fermentans]
MRSKPGQSVSAWIADKTVAEARGMLQNPALTIKEIAIRLGFLEAPHFSNYFKKHISQSPAEYRKLHVGRVSRLDRNRRRLQFLSS